MYTEMNSSMCSLMHPLSCLTGLALIMSYCLYPYAFKAFCPPMLLFDYSEEHHPPFSVLLRWRSTRSDISLVLNSSNPKAYVYRHRCMGLTVFVVLGMKRYLNWRLRSQKLSVCCLCLTLVAQAAVGVCAA